MHTAQEHDMDQNRDQMDKIIPYRNVHTGLRQGQQPGSIERNGR